MRLVKKKIKNEIVSFNYQFVVKMRIQYSFKR